MAHNVFCPRTFCKFVASYLYQYLLFTYIKLAGVNIYINYNYFRFSASSDKLCVKPRITSTDMLATCVKNNMNFVIFVDWLIEVIMWVCCVVCCSRVWCDSVTWRCLRSLGCILNNLEVQRYNTSTTDRHQRQGLETAMGHRRLRANVSAVCRWRLGVCLASVGRRHWHKALAAKVSVGHVQTI